MCVVATAEPKSTAVPPEVTVAPFAETPMIGAGAGPSVMCSVYGVVEVASAEVTATLTSVMPPGVSATVTGWPLVAATAFTARVASGSLVVAVMVYAPLWYGTE